MKLVNISILGLFFLAGINQQAKAQTARKMENKTELEHKEATPVVKETEIKQEPRTEVAAPHYEAPAQEVKAAPQNETFAPAAPVEEHKAEPAEQTEWVKTTPQPETAKPIANAAPQNAPAQASTPVSKLPVFRGEIKPAVRRANFKPLAIDSTKK